MKKLTILIVFVLLGALGSFVQAADKEYSKILGAWVYEAPNAPYPYTDGSIVLKEENKKLVGELNVQGRVIPCQEVTFASDTLVLKMEIEYTPVEAKFVWKDGVFVGKSDTPNGPVIITAKKK